MQPSPVVVPSFLSLARHVPIVLLRPSGAVVGATEAVERVLECRVSEIVGQCWQDVCGDPEDYTRDYLYQCARTLHPIPGAFRRDMAGASVRFRCEGHVTTLPDWPDERFIVLHVRRQDRHDAFILLAQKVEELNAEVARRKSSERQVEAARAETEAASRAKDEFMAMLGHELRNPLSPILTALHLMQRNGVGAAKERRVIERQVKHLVRLVDDLLDVSRIIGEKIELEREEVELRGVVDAAIEMVGALLEKRSVELTVSVAESGLLVEADPVRLSQVVANLLNNAAKYSEHGARVWVTGRRVDRQIVLTVRDTGVGIAPEILPKIFDLFVQERQSLARSQGGLGVGLAVVRGIVALHGGTVFAHSDGRGHGAELTICLPCVATQRDAAGDAALAVERPKLARAAIGSRVLVVDDNQDGAELLSEALQDLGHVTQVAYDGPGALRIAREFAPAIALLDIGLPVMDGYELARHLRDDPVLSAIRLIAITGYGQDSDRERSRDAGFDAHLVKPVDIGKLSSLMEELLREQDSRLTRP